MSELVKPQVFQIEEAKIQIQFTPKTKEVKDNQEGDRRQEEIFGKSKIIGVILALVLGRFGIHKFYLGKPELGLLYLLGSRTELVFYLSILDAIVMILTSNENWSKKYGYKKFPKRKAAAN